MLTNYRNYVHLNVEFCEKMNVLVGDNAQGKTNLLEAIYVSAVGHSQRTTRDMELMRWGTPGFLVRTDVTRRTGTVRMEMSFEIQEGKKFKLDGNVRDRTSSFGSPLSVVMFTPDDLEVVKGSPSARRKFIDTEVSQISPRYRDDLIQYSRILFQRNTVLRQEGRNEVGLGKTLLIWDDQLVNAGLRIMGKRREALRKLAILAKLAHRRITGGRESLEVIYMPSVPVCEGISHERQEEIFKGRLRDLREEERKKRVTLAGPHRDDIAFEVDGVNMRIYGSQAQQRTVVLALKLAEIEFVKSEIGEYPVLLLDDVMSELDEARRTCFLAAVQGRVQMFITTTNTEVLKDKVPAGSCFFKVAGGTVERRTLC